MLNKKSGFNLLCSPVECVVTLGPCDNESVYITIMQLIIMIAMLYKIHLGMVLSYAVLEWVF